MISLLCINTTIFNFSKQQADQEDCQAPRPACHLAPLVYRRRWRASPGSRRPQPPVSSPSPVTAFPAYPPPPSSNSWPDNMNI